MHKKIASTLLFFLLPFCAQATAPQTNLSQQKSQLQQLENKISQLKKTLNVAQDKRSTLNQELATTEKQIGSSVHQLSELQQNITNKQKIVSNHQQKINELSQQLTQQQDLLAQHIRARYKIGEFQPLLMVINQDDPHKVSRLLTFYQHLLQARQESITQIEATKKEIDHNKIALQTEVQQQIILQNKLNTQQQKLQSNKLYHQTLLGSLEKEIGNKRQTLQEFERNKLNLTKLVQNLSRQSIAPVKTSSFRPTTNFINMRRKLPLPVNSRSRQAMNQGLTFFAAEGTPVKAVHGGRIVFSDWLNGYGLLIIVDHGQGFMSLYAHNQSLFKKKGTYVSQGEQLATVGHSGGIKQNGLYFEIRQRGKAVSPAQWLS